MFGEMLSSFLDLEDVLNSPLPETPCDIFCEEGDFFDFFNFSSDSTPEDHINKIEPSATIHSNNVCSRTCHQKPVKDLSCLQSLESEILSKPASSITQAQQLSSSHSEIDIKYEMSFLPLDDNSTLDHYTTSLTKVHRCQKNIENWWEDCSYRFHDINPTILEENIEEVFSNIDGSDWNLSPFLMHSEDSSMELSNTSTAIVSNQNYLANVSTVPSSEKFEGNNSVFKENNFNNFIDCISSVKSPEIAKKHIFNDFSPVNDQVLKVSKTKVHKQLLRVGQERTTSDRIIPMTNSNNVCFNDGSGGNNSSEPSSADGRPKRRSWTVQCMWQGCQESGLSQSQLVEHIRVAHIEKVASRSAFTCHWLECPRKQRPFNAKYKLVIHCRIHSGEKPNLCKRCGKAFSRRENLKIHIRSHTGERPYRCKHAGCQRQFSNSSDRAKHQRTHKHARPYVCQVAHCARRYTDPSSLRKHIKLHFAGGTHTSSFTVS